jgi:hypothetical protein
MIENFTFGITDVNSNFHVILTRTLINGHFCEHVMNILIFVLMGIKYRLLTFLYPTPKPVMRMIYIIRPVELTRLMCI